MKESIKRRLQAVETMKLKNVIPDFVIVFYDDSLKSWIVRETFTKKNPKGGVVFGSGFIKLTKINTPEEYKPPEGFTGTIINEGVLE